MSICASNAIAFDSRRKVSLSRHRLADNERWAMLNKKTFQEILNALLAPPSAPLPPPSSAPGQRSTVALTTMHQKPDGRYRRASKGRGVGFNNPRETREGVFHQRDEGQRQSHRPRDEGMEDGGGGAGGAETGEKSACPGSNHQEGAIGNRCSLIRADELHLVHREPAPVGGLGYNDIAASVQKELRFDGHTNLADISDARREREKAKGVGVFIVYSKSTAMHQRQIAGENAIARDGSGTHPTQGRAFEIPADPKDECLSGGICLTDVAVRSPDNGNELINYYSQDEGRNSAAAKVWPLAVLIREPSSEEKYVRGGNQGGRGVRELAGTGESRIVPSEAVSESLLPRLSGRSSGFPSNVRRCPISNKGSPQHFTNAAEIRSIAATDVTEVAQDLSMSNHTDGALRIHNTVPGGVSERSKKDIFAPNTSLSTPNFTTIDSVRLDCPNRNPSPTLKKSVCPKLTESMVRINCASATTSLEGIAQKRNEMRVEFTTHQNVGLSLSKGNTKDQDLGLTWSRWMAMDKDILLCIIEHVLNGESVGFSSEICFTTSASPVFSFTKNGSLVQRPVVIDSAPNDNNQDGGRDCLELATMFRSSNSRPVGKELIKTFGIQRNKTSKTQCGLPRQQYGHFESPLGIFKEKAREVGVAQKADVYNEAKIGRRYADVFVGRSMISGHGKYRKRSNNLRYLAACRRKKCLLPVQTGSVANNAGMCQLGDLNHYDAQENRDDIEKISQEKPNSSFKWKSEMITRLKVETTSCKLVADDNSSFN